MVLLAHKSIGSGQTYTQSSSVAGQITSTMKTLVLLCSLVALSTQQQPQGPLPNYMLGEFQLETSQGFEDFMYELGVNWFTRKVVNLIKTIMYIQIIILYIRIACTLYPTASNHITPDGQIPATHRIWFM